MEALLYENDMPPITDDYIGRMQDKGFNRFLDKKRWKPNGITNNIEEWRRKNSIIEGMRLLAKVGINSKDIKF